MVSVALAEPVLPQLFVAVNVQLVVPAAHADDHGALVNDGGLEPEKILLAPLQLISDELNVPPLNAHDQSAVAPTVMVVGDTDTEPDTAGQEHVGAVTVGPDVMGQVAAVDAVFSVAVVRPCVTVVNPAAQFVSEPTHCEPFQLVPPGQEDAAGQATAGGVMFTSTCANGHT